MENNFTNNLYSYATYYLNRMTKSIEQRKLLLRSMLDDHDYVSTVVEHAGMFAGRKPGWHGEMNIIERIRKAGYISLLTDFGHLKGSDFDEQLIKGESLMVEKVNFVGDKRKLIKSALAVRNSCRFPESRFTPVSIEYAAENQLNKHSSSGFPYFQRKGLVLDQLIELARNGSEDPNSDSWFWPCVRGFRIQIRESLSKLYRKVRLMYPYPGHLILLEDTFIMPFVEHFINTDTFYVIGLNGEQIGNRLKSRFDRSNSICSLDISAFDQSLVNEAIILAFWIIRSQLKCDRQQSLTFDNIVKYFCTQIMVSKQKGKSVYPFVKDHGVPSGSGFTNMIDTIAHAIILEYLSPGLVSRDALICGDDNIFNSKNINIKSLFEGYKLHFNLTVDPDKTDFYRSSRNVKFLGFKYINYERHISYKLALNQLVWHTDFLTWLDPYERELARGASILLNGKNGASLFGRIFPDVIEKLHQGIDVRYYYLTGYSPPTSLESPSYGKPIPRITHSLDEQIRTGYLTR